VNVLIRGEKLPPRTAGQAPPSAPAPVTSGPAAEPRRANPPLLGGPEPAPA